MLLYYITDRHGFEGNDERQQAALLNRIVGAAQARVDYIQLREKDLSPRQLERLARQVVAKVREHSAVTRVLINGRADVALAVGADGVHLPSADLPASEIRALWAQAMAGSSPVVGISAHSVENVRYGEAHGADFCVLAPVFQKAQGTTEGIGVKVVRAACLDASQPNNTEAAPQPSRFPVLALGGITVANAINCITAGAAGIAGIRLFQTGDIAETVRRLRDLQPPA